MIHTKLGIINSAEAISYFKKRNNVNHGLKDIYYMLNSDEGSEEEKKYKKAFLAFYRWFLKKSYSIYVLKNDKIKEIDGIDRKNIYLNYKNKLTYLPKLTKAKEAEIKRKMM